MQQYIGSRRRTPKALEDVKKFVEWSITSVLLPDYEQDTRIQEIWEATESLKLEKSKRDKKKTKPPTLAELLERISVLEGRLEQLENTKWRRLTRFITGLLKRKPRITQYSADEMLLECIRSGGTTPVKLGQKITNYQKNHDWEETGKSAFNEHFGFAKQQTYTTTISDILGDRVKVTGIRNNARYSIIVSGSEAPSVVSLQKTPPITKPNPSSAPKVNPSKEHSEKPKIKITPEEFSKGLLSQKKRVQPVFFSTLYERLINENPIFNLKQYGIKPNDYLTEKCSDLLTIIEKPDGNTPPTIHYWITDPQ